MDSWIPVPTALHPPQDAPFATALPEPGKPRTPRIGPHPAATLPPGHRQPAGDGVSVVCLDGELDLYTAPQLAQSLLVAQDGGGSVVLDLRGLAFIDCVGLAVISAADLRARLRQSRLILLVRAGGAVERLLDITGTSARFETTTRPPVGVPV